MTRNWWRRALAGVALAGVCAAWGQSAVFRKPVKRAPGAPAPTVVGVDRLHDALAHLGKVGLPAFDVRTIVKALRLSPFTANGWWRKAAKGTPHAAQINLSAAELLDVARLALEAVRIQADAQKAQAQAQAALAAKGIVEEPASTAACRYTLDLGEAGHLVFDVWGEFQIDRRYVKPADMAVIHTLEAYYRKAFASSAYAQTAAATNAPSAADGEILEAAALLPVSRPVTNTRRAVPIFRGFEDARYQQHDALIARLVKDFNAHKAQWIGGTTNQAARVPNLTTALVKAHMIEETGGGGPMSRAAWPVDPEQVNVPGDWSDVKLDLGLAKPATRNEGTAETNVRAAIKFLARKGFGKSGQPVGRRPTGFFDGWQVALQRYNARRDRTLDNRVFSEAYAEKVQRRAANPDVFVPIENRVAAPQKTALD